MTVCCICRLRSFMSSRDAFGRHANTGPPQCTRPDDCFLAIPPGSHSNRSSTCGLEDDFIGSAAGDVQSSLSPLVKSLQGRLERAEEDSHGDGGPVRAVRPAAAAPAPCAAAGPEEEDGTVAAEVEVEAEGKAKGEEG